MNSVYSHIRLQKAIGNIAGTHLGFPTNPNGNMKPLPDTNVQIVKVKRVYPQERIVEFSFMDSEEIYTAYALIDYWHREGRDTNTEKTDINLLKGRMDVTWPFTSPESLSPDLITLLRLLVVMGVKGAAPMLALMEQLTQILEGKIEVLNLIQNQEFTLQTLLTYLNLSIDGLENLTNINQLENIPHLLTALGINIDELGDSVNSEQLENIKTLLTNLKLNTDELDRLISAERLKELKILLTALGINIDELGDSVNSEQLENIKTLLTFLGVDTEEISK